MDSKTLVLWPSSIPSILSILKMNRCTRVYAHVIVCVCARVCGRGVGVEGVEGMERPCNARRGGFHTFCRGMEQVWKIEVRNPHG